MVHVKAVRGSGGSKSGKTKVVAAVPVKAAASTSRSAEPPDQEMAVELGIRVEEFQEMSDESSAVTIFSLSDKFDDQQEEGGLENSEIVADDRSMTPLETLHRRDIIEVLTRNLSQKEKRI